MEKAEILRKAAETIKDRGVPYGGVEDNFGRIARLWNAYLQNEYDGDAGFELTPENVASMMVLLKLARLSNRKDHGDSWIDAAAYMAIAGELATDGPKNTVADTLEAALQEAARGDVRINRGPLSYWPNGSSGDEGGAAHPRRATDAYDQVKRWTSSGTGHVWEGSGSVPPPMYDAWARKSPPEGVPPRERD